MVRSAAHPVGPEQAPATDPVSESVDNTTEGADDGADSPRTRGGFVPSGVGERRRKNHDESGTERGRQTRQRLLDAAHRVFTRDGFLEVRVEDIITEAGVPRGTFYTYFESKNAIFKELALDIGTLIRSASGTSAGGDGDTATERLAGTVRRYLDVYRHEARMLGLVEQLSTTDPEIHEWRREGRRHHVRRVAADVRRLQDLGITDPELNPQTTAAALVSMLSNFAFWLYAGGDGADYDEDAVVATVTRIWSQTLGLDRR